MKFVEIVLELLRLWEDWLSEPQDEVQLQEWRESAELLADSFECTEEEEAVVERLCDHYEAQYRALIEHRRAHPMPSLPAESIQPELDALLGRTQLEQRTAAWYQQMSTVLSASELGHLFASPRQRAKLVLSKTQPPEARYQSLAVPSDHMSAFDWGIRFEPVVKQIYEHRYGVVIKELGRMLHPVDPRCSASPDGLIYHCPSQQRTGHLIEIKCPVTREIDGTVPKDYYAQMQMQLHVTGRTVCEYVEAVFSSAYNQMVCKEGPALYDGWIAVVRYAEPVNGQDFYYVYSPIHPPSDWQPTLRAEEEMVERTPWRLYQWSEQSIQRNEAWWEGIRPIMDAFWVDVEKAKRGEFVLPDSTRAPKPPKERCLIQFQRLNEEGRPYEDKGEYIDKVNS